MRIHRLRQFLAAAALATLGLTGCSAENVSSHVNAVTGAECAPDGSYIPRPDRGQARGNGNGNGQGGEQCQGTGPGDNCDDLHSGKIDCIGDGNSGQGDDRKHNCEFPQPGCDANGCCDDDIVEPPPPPPDEPPPPPPDEDPPPPPPVG